MYIILNNLAKTIGDIEAKIGVLPGNIRKEYTATVAFHSIRQALWIVTHLPKFCFRQKAKLAVTHSKIPTEKCHRLRKIALFGCAWLDKFGSSSISLWHPWHFSIFEGPVICDCQIEWNDTVLLLSMMKWSN